MKNFFSSKKILVLFLSLFVCLILVNSAHASLFLKDDVSGKINDNADLTGDQSGFDVSADRNSIGEVIATIVEAALGLLGAIFIVLIIISGYQWMTAGGDEDQITNAKNRLKNAVIGLIIVVAAYSITAFIFKNLPETTTAPTNGGVGGSGNP